MNSDGVLNWQLSLRIICGNIFKSSFFPDYNIPNMPFFFFVRKILFQAIIKIFNYLFLGFFVKIIAQAMI